MSTFDNLTSSTLSQRNPLSKLFRLKNLWVDNIQFPAYHKKFNLNFWRKSYLTFPWFQWGVATHQGVSVMSQRYYQNSLGEIQTFIGTIIDAVFFPEWNNFCNIVGEVKKSEHWSQGRDFTEQIFTGELFGMDSAGVLRQGV